MNKFIFLISFIVCLGATSNFCFAQESGSGAFDGYITIDGEQVPVYVLPETFIYPSVSDYTSQMSKKDLQRFNKLLRDVKKVYPYAEIAKQIFEKHRTELENAPSEKEKDKTMKTVENELKKEYSGILKQLTISQGKILIKLVDRETENTPYQIIKEFRGTFSAIVWQGIALLFGSNLKEEYDANGDDRDIEYIVVGIEGGWL